MFYFTCDRSLIKLAREKLNVKTCSLQVATLATLAALVAGFARII